MAFTYDLSTNIGKVRLLIPDAVEASAKFTDEELQIFLDIGNDNIYWATFYALETLCSLAAERGGLDVEVGDIDIRSAVSYGTNWCARAKELYQRLTNGVSPESSFAAIIYAGGIYQADRDTNHELMDDDILIKNNFWSNYNDNNDESHLSGGDGISQ